MSSIDENEYIDITSKEYFVLAAGMVMRLFEHWQLSTADQLCLLGFNEQNRSILSRLRQGSALQARRDLLERVAYLFDVHAKLRVIFPKNRNLAYGWMSARSRDLHNLTPVEVVRKNGLIGLNMLNVYLNKIIKE